MVIEMDMEYREALVNDVMGDEGLVEYIPQNERDFVVYMRGKMKEMVERVIDKVVKRVEDKMNKIKVKDRDSGRVMFTCHRGAFNSSRNALVFYNVEDTEMGYIDLERDELSYFDGDVSMVVDGKSVKVDIEKR